MILSEDHNSRGNYSHDDPASKQPRGHKREQLVGITLIIFAVASFFYLFTLNVVDKSTDQQQGSPIQKDNIKEYSVFNSTLGFEKIFTIELPNRLDRKNAMTIQKSLLDLDIVEQPGIDITSFKANGYKGLTPSSGRQLYLAMYDNEFGCFQAHLQTYQRIVEENLNSALILEGDAVFDVHIREILAKSVEHLPQTFKKNNEKYIPQDKNHDPFQSHNWDMFFLTTCYDEPTYSKDSTLYDDEYSLGGGEINTEAGKRRISRAGAPVCLAGYVVSKKGALKLLHYLSQDAQKPIDLRISDMVKQGRLLAYTMNPPVIGSWMYNKDLDISALDSTIKSGDIELLPKEHEHMKVLTDKWQDTRDNNKLWEMRYPANLNNVLNNADELIAKKFDY